MIASGDEAHRFVIHDRDTIYSQGVDRTLEAMGLTVLKTPVRAPQAPRMLVCPCTGFPIGPEVGSSTR
jgi:hypothetical protein